VEAAVPTVYNGQTHEEYWVDMVRRARENGRRLQIRFGDTVKRGCTFLTVAVLMYTYWACLCLTSSLSSFSGG
jgi:hypothetical protein